MRRKLPPSVRTYTAEASNYTTLIRLSHTQNPDKQWPLREALKGCARHNIGHIGIWRDKLAEQPIATTVQQLRDAQLKVSSLCRGGFFSAPTPAARAAQIEDNR